MPFHIATCHEGTAADDHGVVVIERLLDMASNTSATCTWRQYGEAQLTVNHMSWLSEWSDACHVPARLSHCYTEDLQWFVTHSTQLNNGRAVTVQHTAKRMACSSAIA